MYLYVFAYAEAIYARSGHVKYLIIIFEAILLCSKLEDCLPSWKKMPHLGFSNVHLFGFYECLKIFVFPHYYASPATISL